MINFDDTDVSELRSEMEDIQRENDLHSNADDVDNEDDDDDNGNNNDTRDDNDEKKYQLNTKDSEISRMEEKLEKVKLLEVGISDVGHLQESRQDLQELHQVEDEAARVASGGYDAGVLFNFLKKKTKLTPWNCIVSNVLLCLGFFFFFFS